MSRSHGTQAPALQAHNLQHRHDDSSPPPWQAQRPGPWRGAAPGLKQQE
ncbi:hypothetical protein [Streptomyces sp. NL15-2K]|nr:MULTISPECIES: hypothetical protein [Actinomycetes]WKX07205.1 hypothetical protein Q4V64_06780 [Kutzneria buriramensis]